MDNNTDKSTKTREPRQKRSIEKKEKIIEAGFKLISTNGYHNTNTAQIAKEAGVSTGIVYQYFKDKHDILMEGIKRYSSALFYPVLDIAGTDIKKVGLKVKVKEMIHAFIKKHEMTEEAHEQIMSLIHTDHELAEVFHEAEYGMTEQMTEVLRANGYDRENLVERVHICIGLVDNLCHDMIYHNHGTIDYNIMTDIVVDTICGIIEE